MRHQGTGDDSISRHQGTNQRHQGTNCLWTPVRSGPRQGHRRASLGYESLVGVVAIVHWRERTLGTPSGFVLY